MSPFKKNENCADRCGYSVGRGFRKHSYFIILKYWNDSVNQRFTNWIEIKNVKLRKNHRCLMIIHIII